VAGYARCSTDKQDLDQHIIENIEEAQDFATQWLWTYNNDRPNMGIGGDLQVSNNSVQKSC
jgi:hypothetical protein